MNLLTTLLTFFEGKFQYLFTAVSGMFNTILSEIPDDQIAIFHAATSAAAAKLKTGGTAEEALTAGLNVFEAAEVTEGKKLLTDLLNVFVTASSPPTTSKSQ